MSAYLAKQWQLPLVVVTVVDKQVKEGTAAGAEAHLQEHAVQASFIVTPGDPAQVILEVAEAENVGLIIMGGYGQSPLIEMALGSTIDQVLRLGNWPTLVCH